MVLGLNLLRCSSAEQGNILCKFYSKYYNSEERKGSLKKKRKQTLEVVSQGLPKLPDTVKPSYL